MPYQVAVCGPRDATARDAAAARRVGRLLAEQGAVVLCGGGGGVMAAAAAGAREADGLVLGVLPGTDRDGTSPDLSAVLVTNMGEARNAILVWSADAVVIVGGSWGTLSELALAKRRGSAPVISLGGWQILDPDGKPVPGVEIAESADDAVARAMAGRQPVNAGATGPRPPPGSGS